MRLRLLLLLLQYARQLLARKSGDGSPMLPEGPVPRTVASCHIRVWTWRCANAADFNLCCDGLCGLNRVPTKRRVHAPHLFYYNHLYSAGHRQRTPKYRQTGYGNMTTDECICCITHYEETSIGDQFGFWSSLIMLLVTIAQAFVVGFTKILEVSTKLMPRRRYNQVARRLY